MTRRRKNRGEPVLGLGREQLVGQRAAERGHLTPAQVGERAEALAVGLPHGEHLAELVVRDAGRQGGAARRDVFDAAQADVEVAAPRGLVEAAEGHLHELRACARLARDELGDLDVEADTSSDRRPA
jgi:hypothetical protein